VAQSILGDLPEIASITQLGLRLRILVPQSISDPLQLIEKKLAQHDVSAKSTVVPASLEDVFVAVTQKRPRAGTLQ
jgi:ABC-2 type transport system ATP-binding protein